MAKLIHVIATGVGVVLYFAIVYFSVNITIDGLEETYSTGDVIDFTANVSGIGNTLYAYSVKFEQIDGNKINGLHHSGPGPSYLDPPLYFSETIKYHEEIDSIATPGEYLMKFNALGHSVEKRITILP